MIASNLLLSSVANLSMELARRLTLASQLLTSLALLVNQLEDALLLLAVGAVTFNLVLRFQQSGNNSNDTKCSR